VEGRAAGGIAVADGVDPAASLQGFQYVGRHRDSADILDIAAGDRLPIGNDGKRLHHRPGIFWRALVFQPVEKLLVLGARLEAPARSQLHQFDAAIGPVAAQIVQ